MYSTETEPSIVNQESDALNPILAFKHSTTCTSIQRVPTLTELKRQYTDDITRHASLDIATVKRELQSELSPNFLSSEDKHSELNTKLERTWTLMLSHISRNDTSRNRKNLLYLEEEPLEKDTETSTASLNMDSCSSSIKFSPRKSFFNGSNLDISHGTTERLYLRNQSLAVRLMNNKYIRWLYHFCTRLQSVADQITDIVLLISLILTGEDAHAVKYLCFILAPYVVLSFLLISPLTRRSEFVASILYKQEEDSDLLGDSDSDLLSEYGGEKQFRLTTIIFSVLWFPLYVVSAVAYLIGLDCYVYFILMGKDLATTRYLLYYWRLKTIVEILFEAFPQTIFILTNDLHNINPILIICSLTSSTGLFLWSMYQIYDGGKKTGFGTIQYFKRYYVQQGLEMIPYLEAIVQNNLIKLELSENLEVSEWRHMAKSLFFNFSVEEIAIIGQDYISKKSWCLLFYGLENNRLNTIDLRNCKLMGWKPLDSCEIKEMADLESIKLKNVITAFDRDNTQFNPYSKAATKESSILYNKESLPTCTRLVVLYSLHRVINISSVSLINIQLKGNNISHLLPFLINQVSECHCLEKLDLSSNFLGKIAELQLLQTFNKLITKCTQLKFLILDDNGFDDNFAKIFANILSQHVDDTKINLTTLSLEANNMSFFGAKMLLKICTTHDITINLEKNDIETQQWTKLMHTVLQSMHFEIDY